MNTQDATNRARQLMVEEAIDRLTTTMRDYRLVELSVLIIQEAVEQGFDTRSDDGYEFFAMEGQLGNPDDLTDYQFMHLESQVHELAKDAVTYLGEQ